MRVNPHAGQRTKPTQLTLDWPRAEPVAKPTDIMCEVDGCKKKAATAFNFPRRYRCGVHYRELAMEANG